MICFIKILHQISSCFWLYNFYNCFIVRLALDIDLRTNNCGKYTGAKWVSCRQPVSWMKMNGKTVMHLMQGWNLAVVDHKTGKIEKTSNFPTFRSISANIQLEKFVESIEDKRIVLGVVHHDGSRFLDSRGERALVRIIESFCYCQGSYRQMYCKGLGSKARKKNLLSDLFSPKIGF